ncbi:endoplasmic reticulum metallopeptidase 1-like [Amphibalanus amphitrite]|uniref:endoplasmic reticulum metallopeptidase 1-like n=1 Tax=Amphibalanus amphitrite TaxID=1232801 RepID=UPI001C906B99|nr:endoplasmic reticulum metallopeptidase 1-like [Amphibalanus amphitrite]
MDSDVRRRAGRRAPADGGASRGAVEKQSRSAAGGGGGSARPYGWGLALLLAALFAGLYVLGHQVEERHPEPAELEVNARRFLRRLVALGPRICGSEENERHAVKILLDELEAIQKTVPSHHQLTIDRQVVSGSFKMQSLDGVTSEYANVQNIVARLGPAEPSEHSVLVNCHFDTAIGSPGASDDGVSCAVMMEVLRRIARSDVKLQHNIIFLFNGAEENMLQAAHGFITQHSWAWSVRAHVNLEACGAGGREIVFQTGPGHPWLVKAYAESVPHPFAHIIGQEVFQSGIIPSDTDFRIFRDYGRIPGLDTAFIRNGYVYHTPYDDERQITAGSVQRAGENVEAILLRLATENDIIDAHKQEVGTMVFLDYMGLFMLIYPDWLSELICLVVALLAGYTIFDTLRIRGLTVSQLLLSAGVQLFSWLVAAAVVAVIAIGLDSWNATMSWYAARGWIIGLYTAPVLGTLILVQQGLSGLLFPKLRSDPARLEALLYESQRLLLAALMIGLALVRLYSSVAFMLLLLVPTLVRSVVTERVCGVTSGPVHLATYILSQLAPAGFLLNLVAISLELFIPITGRMGNSLNPELIIGVLMTGYTILCSLYAMTSLSLVGCHRQLSRLLLLVGLLSVALVTLTPLGFPYSSDRPHIRAQRVWVQHVDRTFRETDGSVRRHDSGFMLMNMDRNSPRSLSDALPELATAANTGDDCDKELYCGAPYYYPFRRRVYENSYIAGPAPELAVPLEYRTGVEKRPDGVRRVHFNITGPDHMTMQLSPRPGVQLLRWNLADGVPLTGQEFQGRPTYFLYFSWGRSSAPWTIWADFKVSEQHETSDYLTDAVINGHHIHGPAMKSASLREFLARLPDWTVAVGFSSALEAIRV